MMCSVRLRTRSLFLLSLISLALPIFTFMRPHCLYISAIASECIQYVAAKNALCSNSRNELCLFLVCQLNRNQWMRMVSTIARLWIRAVDSYSYHFNVSIIIDQTNGMHVVFIWNQNIHQAKQVIALILFMCNGYFHCHRMSMGGNRKSIPSKTFTFHVNVLFSHFFFIVVLV